MQNISVGLSGTGCFSSSGNGEAMGRFKITGNLNATVLIESFTYFGSGFEADFIFYEKNSNIEIVNTTTLSDTTSNVSKGKIWIDVGVEITITNHTLLTNTSEIPIDISAEYL